jgi:hypothetical protein
MPTGKGTLRIPLQRNLWQGTLALLHQAKHKEPTQTSKCKEHCGNTPEAVIRQATMKLNSQVWKSLEDSVPKPYCADLAEAYVMQESRSSKLMCRKIKRKVDT